MLNISTIITAGSLKGWSITFRNNSGRVMRVSRAVVAVFGLTRNIIDIPTATIPSVETKADFQNVMPEPFRVCLDELLSNGKIHSSMQPSSNGVKYAPYLTIIPQTKVEDWGIEEGVTHFEFTKTPVWKPVVKSQPTSLVLSLRDSQDNLLHIDPILFHFCCELRLKQRVLIPFT